MSNNNSLKVLLAGAECAPFVKLGGLADVMGTWRRHALAQA